MGGLRKYMPITAGTFIVGWLAIAGIVPVRRASGRRTRSSPRRGSTDNYALWAVGVGRRAAHRVLHDPPGVARLLRQRALATHDAERRGRRGRPTPARRGRTTHGTHEPHESPWIDDVPARRARRARRSSAGSSTCRSRTQSSTSSTAGSSPCFAARPRSERQLVRRRVRARRRSRSSLAVVGIVLGRARLPQRARRRRRATRRSSGSAPFAKVLANAYYFDVGLARFVSGPVTAFARFLSDGVDRKVIDGAVNGIGARVPRGAAAGCARCRPGWCATTRSAIVLGAVLLLVFVTTRVTSDDRAPRPPPCTRRARLPAAHRARSSCPRAGAVLTLLMPARRPELTRVVGYVTSAATFGLAVYLLVRVRHAATRGYQFVVEPRVDAARSASAGSLGVDGISLFMVALTALLIPIGLLASAEHREAEVVHGLDAAARGGGDRRVPRARPRSCSSSSSSSCSCRCTSSSRAGATATGATRR